LCASQKRRKLKEEDRPEKKKTTGRAKKRAISVEKSFKSPTKHQQNSVALLLHTSLRIKNNGRELCKDGSAFRRRGGRRRRVVAPSTGGESGNDGTYLKKKRESVRELDFFDHLSSALL
jgi:hypothetical protein